MNDLSLYFSAALLCIITVFTMMNAVVAGQTNTMAKYTVSILITVVGTIMFGIMCEEIVNIIRAM